MSCIAHGSHTSRPCHRPAGPSLVVVVNGCRRGRGVGGAAWSAGLDRIQAALVAGQPGCRLWLWSAGVVVGVVVAVEGGAALSEGLSVWSYKHIMSPAGCSGEACSPL